MRAARAPGGPAPSPWDHRPAPTTRPVLPAPTIGKVAFLGARDGPLHRQLLRWGTPLTDGPDADAGMLVIDGGSLSPDDAPQARQRIAGALDRGGIVLVMLGAANDAHLDAVNALLPAPIALTARQATMLVHGEAHPWTAALGMSDLYFAENAADKFILRRGLAGPFVAAGTTALEAGNIDWSLFDAGESVKCGALVLYEHLKKPAGAAFVVREQGPGRSAATTITAEPSSPAHAALWRKLLAGMGVRMEAPRADTPNTGAAGKRDLLRDGPQPP